MDMILVAIILANIVYFFVFGIFIIMTFIEGDREDTKMFLIMCLGGYAGIWVLGGFVFGMVMLGKYLITL